MLDLVYAELGRSTCSSLATRRNLIGRYHKIYIRIRLWCTFIRRWKCFYSEWQWRRWYYWHRLHTKDWQYILLTYCTCSPYVYRISQCVTINRNTPHQYSSPLSIFMHFFFESIQLKVEETNRYYHRYLDTLDKGQSQLPDVTVQEMCLFWAFLCRWGTIRGTLWKITGRHKNILHDLLWKQYEKRLNLSYT
jgi:hypothetical protein